MKKLLFICTTTAIFALGCKSVRPTDFTYLYDQLDTGLSARINTDGYYTSARDCDTSFFSVFMFYPDGLFTIATTSNIDAVTSCFSNGGNSKICQYPSWGTYRIYGDTIKTQTIVIEGMAASCIFRDYLIGTDKSLTNISDYVNPKRSKLMYMQNYPSFRNSSCPSMSQFFHLPQKRDKSECPYLRKDWFYKKAL